MKNSLLTLSALLRNTADFFGKHEYMVITASVVIQNMSAKTNEWNNWSDYNEALDLLKDFAAYRPDHHVLQWAYSEARMIVIGHFMSLEEDNCVMAVYIIPKAFYKPFLSMDYCSY